MVFIVRFLIVGCCALSVLFASEAPELPGSPESPWPLDIPHAAGVITLYQPQLEKLAGATLTGRAAVSYRATGKNEDDRVFGALWFTAVLDIDRENDVAHARSMTITKVVTPPGEKTTDNGAAVKKVIQDAVIARGIEIDLDRLIATLEEPSNSGTADFNPTPPRMIIRQEPSILVVIDGEPLLRDAGEVKRVVNTPAFLVSDRTGIWWLRGDRDWLTAAALEGPWTFPPNSPPSAVTDAASTSGYSTSYARASNAKAPAVIIAKDAAELVVFDGKPSFEPIGDGALLGASNTDTTVLVEVASGKTFMLLAGRWYRAAKLSDDATWELVKPNNLPTTFASIPATSEWKNVRAHIAGTPEADEATVQQQIPQTARIPRSSSITITCDGEPHWISISKLAVEYAENSADAVFRIPGPLYYACRDGVWYESKNMSTPFMVATSVPDALRHLPADCPWHNCSYVYVYESTPEYVWCGYTPGYMGWYSWYGCPIYGTGYRYPGWYGPVVIYPRPITWGVGIHYNPWTGWGVSVGVGGPHWSIGISTGGGYHGGGWWGCGGSHTINNITIDNSNNIHIGNGNRPGNPDINRPSQRPHQGPAIYDRVPGADRPKMQEAGDRLRGGNTQARSASTGPTATPRRDNLAVDRDGTIARPTNDGNWQARDNGGWKDLPQSPQRPTERPTTPPQRSDVPVSRPTSSFENTQQMRNRGEQRVQQRSRPTSRPSGGGGGGRRR